MPNFSTAGTTNIYSQDDYGESNHVIIPNCKRLFWQGTHWQATVKKPEGLARKLTITQTLATLGTIVVV
jgi:uncharacterized protein with PIN domain